MTHREWGAGVCNWGNVVFKTGKEDTVGKEAQVGEPE